MEVGEGHEKFLALAFWPLLAKSMFLCREKATKRKRCVYSSSTVYINGRLCTLLPKKMGKLLLGLGHTYQQPGTNLSPFS